MFLLKKENEIYNKTLQFVSPIGSLDYKGLDWPKDAPKIANPHRLHNMYETGDTTYHTGVLLRALAWRMRTFDTTKKEVMRLLRYFELSQAVNDGCLVRNWVRVEGYNQFDEINKNGTAGANWFGDCEPEGSMRYRAVQHANVNYMVRYDISVDAIVTAATGLYWAWVWGDEEVKQLVKQIATTQLDFYKRTNWQIRDDQNGTLLRYGRHWKWNPLCNINSKILNYLATGKKETFLLDWLLNKIVTKIPEQPRHEHNQFNNYMTISALAVLHHIGYDVVVAISNLVKETAEESNYCNNKIFNWVFKIDAMITTQLLPELDTINVHWQPSDFAVPHNQRHNCLNAWEANPYRLAIGDMEDRKYELPQGWWLENYWCYSN